MSNVIDMSSARQKKADKDHGERQVLSTEAVNRAIYAGRYYLTIEDDAVAIKVYFGLTDSKTAVRVKTAKDYCDFFETEMKRFGLKEDDLHIQASSSIDFPDEYTSDPDTIKLCEQINS
jgi:hypothetical protein